MNTFTKLLAPAALAFAAFGAQASEITAGDIGAQPVTVSTAAAVPITGPVGQSGQLAVGDLGTAPVTASQPRVQRDMTAQPVRSLYVIGA
ncbi:MAG: hypothetical protein EHM87_14575 [Burkholderiales bacterium]|nr:MAG: hypothetical protein EHM87_14575 [Burkholderiales bacterium]